MRLLCAAMTCELFTCRSSPHGVICLALAGAFYTFARNHNAYDAAPQELYRWPATAAAARNALALRYSFLPYMYGLFAVAHLDGGTVLRPVFWHTPANLAALEARGQWLLGRNLMVSPVLEAGVRGRDMFIPSGTWLCLAGCGQVSAAAPGAQAVDASVHGGTALLANVLRVASAVSRECLRVLSAAARASRQLAVAAASGSRGDALSAQRSCAQRAIIGRMFQGPTQVRVEGVALDMVPLWVRSGAIIPRASALHAASSERAQRGRLMTAEAAVVKQPLQLLVVLDRAPDGTFACCPAVSSCITLQHLPIAWPASAVCAAAF